MDYEKKIDIPFGAKDSELNGWEYTIPEGMEAIIKDGKVIVREKKCKAMKAIESIIRVYGKTQGEWIDGYDMDTLVVHLRKAFAALEKQKEQSITAKSLDEEIRRFFDDCIDVHEAKLYGSISERVIPVDCYELTARHFAKWGEKQKEQSLRDFIDDFPYSDEQKEQKPAEVKDPFSNANFVRGYESGYADAKREQKPTEWSEEDEKIITALTKALIGSDSAEKIMLFDGVTIEMVSNWLKSLRPQPREEIYQSAKHDLAIRFMNYLDKNRPEGKMGLSNGECEDIDKAFKENDWAKIMRYVEKYRPSWKPSDEQMQCLLAVITNQYNAGAESCHLTLGSLYNDLKKLI